MAKAGNKVHVYVRAYNPLGKVVTCHVQDLTEESFRDFVMQVLVDAHMVVGVKTDETVKLYTRPDYKEEEDVA